MKKYNCNNTKLVVSEREDWYDPDEVDSVLAELRAKLAAAEKRIEGLEEQLNDGRW